MKLIGEFGITYLGSIINSSEIAKLSIQLAAIIRNEDDKLARRISELANSHYNLKEVYLKAYQTISSQINELNSGLLIEDHKIKNEIERAAYCFLTCTKTALDLLMCLIDIIENRKIKIDYLTDYSKFKSKYPKISEQLKVLRSNEQLKKLINYRNEIIHRGYSLVVERGDDDKSFYVFITKVEIAFADFENSELVAAIDLIDKRKVDIEEIFQELNFGLCKMEYNIAKIIVDSDTFGMNLTKQNKWLDIKQRVIENY